MAPRIASFTLSGALLLAGALVACDSGAPAQPQGEKVAAAAPVAAPAAELAAAAEPAKGEGEEGCIYGDKHEEHKNAEGEEGCSHGEAGHGHGHGGAAGEGGHFGAAFAMSESKPLADVLASGAAPEAAVQVRGQIDTVCQKKGCWLVLKDGESTARVLMKDHAFTVPMDSKGKAAVVEGTLASRTFNEKEVKHLEKDGGGDPGAVGGERTEHVLTATAIAITNS